MSYIHVYLSHTHARTCPHSLSLFHQPENFLLVDESDAPVVKLIDFGFARVTSSKDDLQTPCLTAL